LISGRRLRQIAVLLSLIVLLWNIHIFKYAWVNQYPPEDIATTSIMLSLLPAAILIIALRIYRGEDTRMFRIMLGVMSMTYAWEFIADPWSVSLRMSMNLPLMPLIIYNLIGAVFLVIAVIAFKRVE
jgi:hypothetical protein